MPVLLDSSSHSRGSQRMCRRPILELSAHIPQHNTSGSFLPFTHTPFPLAVAVTPRPELDISKLDPAVQFFCDKGKAESTHETYQSALHRFGAFCTQYDILSPFSVSEALLCYFFTAMANEGLTPKTIKTSGSHLLHADHFRPKP